MLSDIALGIFVFAVAVIVIVLLGDLWLSETDKTTITQFSVKYPIFGLALIGWTCILPISLALHFWLYDR